MQSLEPQAVGLPYLTIVFNQSVAEGNSCLDRIYSELLSLSLYLPTRSFSKEKALPVCKQKSFKYPFCLSFMQTEPQESMLFATHDSAMNVVYTQNYFMSLPHPVLEEASCSFLSSLIFSSKSKALPIACMQNNLLCTHMTSTASAQHNFTRKLCAMTELKQGSKTPGKCENYPSAQAVFSTLSQKLGRLGRVCEL